MHRVLSTPMTHQGGLADLDAAAAAADPFLVVRLGILYDVLCYGCVYGDVHVCVVYLEANSCRNGSKKA